MQVLYLIHSPDYALSEYRYVSAAGTAAETLARLMRRADLARNLTIPHTTGYAAPSHV
jgi:hypothetical protein